MTPPDAPRTPRGLAGATQGPLVRAAREVFERDGFIDARIADITATARTATGSLHLLHEQGGDLRRGGRQS